MKTKTKKPPALADMFHGGGDSLVFWSFRYFLGRRTIATVGFAQELARAWPLLNESTQTAVIKQLEDEFARDDYARENGAGYRPLGHDCDRAAWQLVRDAYSKS